MQINSVNSQSFHPQEMSDSFNKVKKSFDDIGSALSSGNLSDAKTALSDLQKFAPKNSNDTKSPMNKEMNELSSAIESGDLAKAQSAYSDIKEHMSNRPSGPPPDVSAQTSAAEATNSSGLLNTTA
jgi:hypothetical protein